MLSTVERILLLKAVDFFQRFASEELLPVARVMEEVTFESGERFIAQGDVGNCLYILAAGEASVVIRGVGEVARRGPRGVIGEMAVISHQPRAADCVALSPITALRLDYDAFWELLTEKPRLAEGVIQVLARRLDEAVANLQRLSQGEASEPPQPLTPPTA